MFIHGLTFLALAMCSAGTYFKLANLSLMVQKLKKENEEFKQENKNIKEKQEVIEKKQAKNDFIFKKSGLEAVGKNKLVLQIQRKEDDLFDLSYQDPDEENCHKVNSEKEFNFVSFLGDYHQFESIFSVSHSLRFDDFFEEGFFQKYRWENFLKEEGFLECDFDIRVYLAAAAPTGKATPKFDNSFQNVSDEEDYPSVNFSKEDYDLLLDQIQSSLDFPDSELKKSTRKALIPYMESYKELWDLEVTSFTSIDKEEEDGEKYVSLKGRVKCFRKNDGCYDQ